MLVLIRGGNCCYTDKEDKKTTTTTQNPLLAIPLPPLKNHSDIPHAELLCAKLVSDLSVKVDILLVQIARFKNPAHICICTSGLAHLAKLLDFFFSPPPPPLHPFVFQCKAHNGLETINQRQGEG